MNELKELRNKLGITQVEAASYIGVSRRTYQTYEEKEQINEMYKKIHEALREMNTTYLNAKIIKDRCAQVFIKYPEVKCAYLYGSFARNQANKDSDVDILVVTSDMGMRFFGLASDLEEVLEKKVDLQSYEQVIGNEKFMERFLVESIKIWIS